ncbi:tetratricopeptide repeat protein 19, mitochondrial-like [Rhodnius prolixus]|uniref:Putative tetratricopeptide repeat protein 19 mitochondrial n=1 Tax=Rhodnius prolixus TaxID=13249 RepID=A0A4P6D6I1_RHOPR
MATYFKCIWQIKSKFVTYTKSLGLGLGKTCKKKYYFLLRNPTSFPKTVYVSFSFFSWAVVNVSADYKKDLQDQENEWRKERIVSQYISLAEVAIKEGDMDKAVNLLGKALKVSENTCIIGITCVYDMLATIAFKKGNVSEASQLLEEAIAKLSESNNKEDKNMLVNFSLKLARLYESDGKFDLAELGFRNCVAIQKNKYLKGAHDDETTTLWINSLFWYGKFLAQSKRYQEAKQCFESAYVLIPHVKSIGNEQAMVTLYNLGEMSFATGDNEGALKHLLNAVIIGKSLKSPDLPIYYNKIGLVYLYRGIHNEAKRWCTNGLEASARHHNKSVKKESEDCLKEIERLRTSKTKKQPSSTS